MNEKLGQIRQYIISQPECLHPMRLWHAFSTSPLEVCVIEVVSGYMLSVNPGVLFFFF